MEEDPFYTAFFSALQISSSYINFWAILSLAKKASCEKDKALILAWLSYIKHSTKYKDFMLLQAITDTWEDTWLSIFERTAYVGRNKHLKSAYALLK